MPRLERTTMIGNLFIISLKLGLPGLS